MIHEINGPLMSRDARKPDNCLCENKGAGQLRSNCEADQRLCFRYTDSTSPRLLIPKNFKPLACFCDCTGWFVSDLVGNPEDRFSRVAAHLSLCTALISVIVISMISFCGNRRAAS